ncbi:hypothetical protein LPB41_06670 [Thalassospira sp. MA62]|nr:hypothetical protein [Thalassospira sp. MA62]
MPKSFRGHIVKTRPFRRITESFLYRLNWAPPVFNYELASTTPLANFIQLKLTYYAQRFPYWHVNDFDHRPSLATHATTLKVEVDITVREVQLRPFQLQQGFCASTGRSSQHYERPQMKLTTAQEQLPSLLWGDERLLFVFILKLLKFVPAGN